MSTGNNIVYIGVIIVVSVVGTQIMLAIRKGVIYGCIIPMFFLSMTGYNLYKSLYVYNPHPTMQEGIMMGLGIVGFLISLLTLVICKIVLKYIDHYKD